jgi:hypothetical protein
MTINPLLPFPEGQPPEPISTNDEMPKGDMDIYYRSEESFLPEGKKLEDLTPEELEVYKNKIRFSHMVPSSYQLISGMQGMI